jgi:hypothetical protein
MNKLKLNMNIIIICNRGYVPQVNTELIVLNGFHFKTKLHLSLQLLLPLILGP